MLLGCFWPPSKGFSDNQDPYSWDELLYRMHCLAPSSTAHDRNETHVSCRQTLVSDLAILTYT